MADNVTQIHVHIPILVVGFAGLLLTVVAKERSGRRLFWGGLLIACVCAFFAAYPASWTLRIGMSLFVAGMTTFTAYMYTSFIKIRGKIYAFSVSDSQPDPSPDGTPRPGSDDPNYDPAPDSYGGMATAKKFWWLLIVTMIICVGTVDTAKLWSTALSVGARCRQSREVSV
jgi:hypothetical protein